MTKKLRRGLSWAVIAFDVMMIYFFVGDALFWSPSDFRPDAVLAFLFAVNAIMTKDYINYLNRDIRAEEEEREADRIPEYRNKVRYNEPEEEEYDTEELIAMLQQKKNEYLQRQDKGE